MTNTTLKAKFLSLLIMLTMLVGMVPLSGIISFAVESADCDHTDTDYDAFCDACIKFMPIVSGEVTYGEKMTIDLPVAYQKGFVTFVPEVSGEYYIRSFESEKSRDPYLFVYNANGERIAQNDDHLGLYRFYLEVDLVAGETYYLGIYERDDNFATTFIVNRICDEHIPSENVDCRGTICSVCENYYGEGNDNHVPDGDVTCLGTLCSVCWEYYGEKVDHTLDGDVTCLGTRCSVCWEYFGEVGDHTPDGDATCLGTLCSVCYEYYGEAGDHTPDGEANCLGTLCSVCFEYYGEPAYDHEDADGDGLCDVCNTLCPTASATITEEVPLTLSIVYSDDGKTFVEFVPENDGYYVFVSQSSSDPVLRLYDSDGYEIGHNDDYFGLNFRLEVSLAKGETYYLGLYDLINEAECTVTVSKGCDHETESEQTCEGYLCKWCGEYYGETGDHETESEQTCEGYLCKWCGEYYGETMDHETESEQTCEGYLCKWCGEYYGEGSEHIVTNYEYDVYYHWGNCDECGGYVSYEHAFDENGDCVCGYFQHEHLFDAYSFDASEHWLICSICGQNDPSYEYWYHEYNADGVCICGREHFNEGIYLGTKLLRDGEYLDNDGNVSTTLPEGGYAYYKDGKLTINNFHLVNFEENPVYDASAIYSEVDLEIELVGNNRLEVTGDDVIFLALADLTINGNGSVAIINYEYYDEINNVGFTADGIDIDGGNLTIDGGLFVIKASDHGIEVDGGNLVINGGIFEIDAGDDGIDVAEDITINSGIFDIKVEDNGIDSEGDIVINGGSFIIETDDDVGIEADTGSITINGGNFDIDSTDECIDGLNVLINDGNFVLDPGSGDEAIRGYESLEFGEAMGDPNVVYYDAGDGVEGYYVWADFNGDTVYDGQIFTEDKKMLSYSTYVETEGDLLYNGEEKVITFNVYNSETEELLTEGVDYTVELLADAVKEAGAYYAVITGIGDYTGQYVVDFYIDDCVDIAVGETINVNVSLLEEGGSSFVKFVPEVTATYIFEFEYVGFLFIGLLNSDMIPISTSSQDVDGVYTVEVELEAGKTYYLDVFTVYGGGTAKATLDIICPGHVGGEATYTEQAICEICGEHYGELRECPGHFGGEATYQESPICEECGAHYGDKLHCDHMCHKGGIHAIVWGIFEKIYDFFGIETECKCGEKH